MSEVILFGEPMAMFVAKTPGRLHEVEEFTRLLAGAEVNVAIGLKRLGHSVSYVTKLGTDPFGVYIEEKLKTEGIETQITKDNQHFTGYQLKNKVFEGDPEVFYYRKNSAASYLNEEDAEKVDFEGAKVLHLTGIPPALSQSCRNATYRMIERARENAMIVTFDPNLRPTLWESKSVMIRTINDLASRADIVLPGTGEGKVLMGSEDPKEILKQIQAGTTKPCTVIEDRRKAIEYAAEHAAADDVILVAGKGHEDYQEVKGVKHHFSDVEETREALRKLRNKNE